MVATLAQVVRDNGAGQRTPAAEETHLTDMGNAERLVNTFGGHPHYVKEWGWYVYDGKRWEKDTTGQVMRRAKQTVRDMYREVADAYSTERAHDLAEWAKRSESAARLKAMVELAESDQCVTARPEDFDKDVWLLNVANGTLDLRNGTLRPHNPTDRITKLAPVEYHPTAHSDVWDRFLRDVFQGNDDLIAYMRRAIGYSLTGSVREPAFFIPYGGGRNGKSTLLNAVAYVMGEYAADTPKDTFVERKFSGGATNDLAALAGVRLVTASETGQDETLNVPLIKRVTGGDKVTAKYLYREYFSYTPQMKVWLATNNKPQVPENTVAIWSRVKLLPFDASFADSPDTTMGEKLRDAAPAILAWAVQGAAEWYRDGLHDPEIVTATTGEYRAEQDDMAAFLAECCEYGADLRVTSRDLYTAYKEWAWKNGVDKVSSRGFSELVPRSAKKGVSKTKPGNVGYPRR